MWLTIQGTSEEWWLSSLAQKYLGDWKRYDEIYEANKDVMPDANTVYPGLKIWIPVEGKPKPTTTTEVSTDTQPGVPTVYTTGPGQQSEFTSHSSEAVSSQTSQAVAKAGMTKWLMIGGIALAIAGIGMTVLGDKSRTAA